MSSKSRKKSTPPAEKRSGASAASPAAGVAGKSPSETKRHGFDIPDEVVHVPGQVNKIRFLLMVGLVIVLLVIFLVPGAITNLGRISAQSKPVATWEHPTEGLVALARSEYYDKKRSLDAALGIDIFLKYLFGIQANTLTDEDAMHLIILDRLAQDAGVEITNQDLREHLLAIVQQRFQGSREAYKGYLDERGGGVVAVEETLRSLLRARRYLDLLGYVAQVPDPKAIEKLWAEQHVAYAFDYVGLEVSGFEDQAQKEVPSDEELKAWYEALPAAQRNAYLAPERRSAEFAYYATGSDAPQALLDAFPRPADQTAEDEAQNYYNRFYFVRFKRPEKAQDDAAAGKDDPPAGQDGQAAQGNDPATPPAGEGGQDPQEGAASGAGSAGSAPAAGADGSSDPTGATPDATAGQEPATPSEPQYLSFDDVHDVCLREAPVYFAMERWLRDLQSRQPKGASLTGEAEKYGLQTLVPEKPLGMDALTELLQAIGGSPLAVMAFSTPPDQLAFNVQVQPSALTVLRVTEKIAPAPKPFDEVRPEVTQKWIDQHAAELATQKLAALRDSLPVLDVPPAPADEKSDAPKVEVPEAGAVHHGADEQAFRAAAEAAGFTVERRDWLDRAAPAGTDSQEDDPAHLFLAAHPEYDDLVQDEVPAPQASSDGQRVYLVRMAGKRDVPISDMTPAELDKYRQQSAMAVRAAVSQDYLKTLDELYHVQFFFGGDEKKKDGAAKGTAAPADGATGAEQGAGSESAPAK